HRDREITALRSLRAIAHPQGPCDFLCSAGAAAPKPARPISRDNLLSAATRFSVDGWVENRLSIPRPDNGLTIKRGAVVGLVSAVSFGTSSAIRDILTSAEASASGRPLMRAPRLSAAYSRVRLIAI